MFGSRDRPPPQRQANTPIDPFSAGPDEYGIDSITGPNSTQTEVKTHHFHIYATKHNTHITLTDPNRNSIISLSAGNIGFRKAARGTYDAAYQLTSYVFGRMQEEGLLRKIQNLEVVLRGFGIGREAVTKALLGTEGRLLRPKIKTVSDATRLKFGGTRSRKPRRLG
jgi:small subunit ribosomal protein S11